MPGLVTWFRTALALATIPAFLLTSAPPDQTSICFLPVRESPDLDSDLSSEATLAEVSRQLATAIAGATELRAVPLAWPGDLLEEDELPTLETLVGFGRMAGCSGVVVTQLRVFDFDEEEADALVGTVRRAASAVMLTGGLVDVQTRAAAAPTGGQAIRQSPRYRGPSPGDVDDDPATLERSLLGDALADAAAEWRQSIVDGLPALTPGVVEPPSRRVTPAGIGFGEDEFALDVNRGFDRRGVIALVNRGDEARSFVVLARSDDSDVAIGFKGEGSEDEAGTLGAGQWKFVRVVANVATPGEREVPLALYTSGPGEEPDIDGVPHDQVTLRLRVVKQPVDIHLERVGQDPHTLAYDYRIENRSDEPADLEIVPAGDHAGRIRLEPSMESLRLRPGEARVFRVAPRLRFDEPVLEASFAVLGGAADLEERLRFEVPPGRRLFYGTTSTTQGSSGAGGGCTNSGNVTVTMGDVTIWQEGDEMKSVFQNSPGGPSFRLRAAKVWAWMNRVFGTEWEQSKENGWIGRRGESLRPMVARYWPRLASDSRDLPSVVGGTTWVAAMAVYALEGEAPAAWLFAFNRETREVGPEVRLSEPYHRARWPYLHVAGDDDRAFVVWEDDQGEGSDVALRRSGPGITDWGPVQYLTRRAGGVVDPVVVSKRNRVVVAWQDDREGASRIYFRLSDDGGASFGDETALPADQGESQAWPQVALGDGTIDVVWTSRRDDRTRVVARRLDGEGRALGDVATLSNPGEPAGEPHVLVAGDRVIAAWREGEGSDSEIWFRSGDGAAWQPAVRVTDDASYSEYPRLVPTGDGLAIFFSSDASDVTDLTYVVETRDEGARWSRPRAMPAVSGRIDRAWLTVRFGLQWPRSDYDSHDTFVHLNGVQVGALEQTVPEGVYVFDVPAEALAATATDLGPGVVTVTTDGMNQADYVELQDVRLIARRAFTQVPVVAADQDEANRLAATAAAGLNHSLPDLVVAAGDAMTYLPDEPEAGDTITLGLEVHNLGEALARGATIGVYAGDPADPMTDLASARLAVTSLADLVAGGRLEVDLQFTFDPARTARVFVAALLDGEFLPLDNSWGLGFSAGASDLPTPLFGTDIPDLFRAPGLLDSVRLPDVRRFERLLHLPSLERWADVSLWREAAQERWKNAAVDRFETALNERLGDAGLPPIDVRAAFARLRR